MYGPITEMLHAKAYECDHILYTIACDRKYYLFILDCFVFFFSPRDQFFLLCFEPSLGIC